MYLGDKTKIYFHQLINDSRMFQQKIFVEELCGRFRELVVLNIMEKFNKLIQENIILKYQKQFEEIKSLLLAKFLDAPLTLTQTFKLVL